MNERNPTEFYTASRYIIFGALSYNHSLYRKTPPAALDKKQDICSKLLDGSRAFDLEDMSRNNKNTILDECRRRLLDSMSNALRQNSNQDRDEATNLVKICLSMPAMTDLSPQFFEKYSDFILLVSALHTRRRNFFGGIRRTNALTRTGKLITEFAGQLNKLLEQTENVNRDQPSFKSATNRFNELCNEVPGGKRYQITHQRKGGAKVQNLAMQ